jgi:hypothetical protein
MVRISASGTCFDEQNFGNNTYANLHVPESARIVCAAGQVNLKVFSRPYYRVDGAGAAPRLLYMHR